VEKVPFNRPSMSSDELLHIEQSIASRELSGGGYFTRLAQSLLKKELGGNCEVLLTTSCTHALEVAAILLNLQPGDEVIVPAFTFPSTALAFVMHGANVIFADCRPDTLNLDESLLENLITPNTRAIVPVHYAGISCDMDKIMDLANSYDLIVIEDNAHGLFGKYKNKSLGTIGHLATQSFHETKNITCGEGGALIINEKKFYERAEIILEKGTNRKRFFRGQVDKYSWVDKGSSYILADLLASMLCAQLKRAKKIQNSREKAWNLYYEKLEYWASNNNVKLPFVPDEAYQPFHMFYLLVPDVEIRDSLLNEWNSKGVNAVFHYLPLNRSEMGRKFSTNSNSCSVAEDISNRIIRLPFYTDISLAEQEKVVSVVLESKW